ncbi:MAG: lytic transglycosylase domain-containing protein [Spirochaetales bacterium]|nr:lytic transglycosylase domain-containing protein [Spirochaetales bacterium]
MNSCTINRVFEIKKDDFLSRMSQKDYSFLSEVDYLKNSIKEINRLGDGASYYMSFVYKNNNMLLFSNKLLYQEIQNKHPYYGPKAAYELLDQLIDERDYIKAEAHALDFLDNYKGVYPDITKQLIESMYWQKKDELVIPYIENLDRSLFSDYANYELDMLKTVSSARLSTPGWEKDYISLFLNQPLSPLLDRAYSFIDVYPEYAQGFTKNQKNFFLAMALGSRGDYSNAQRILKPLLLSESWILGSSQSIKNCSNIIKSSRYINQNLDAFHTALNRVDSAFYNEALVAYASLYFNIESFTSTVNILEDELDKIPFGKVKDDAIWLYLLSLSHVGLDRIVTKLDFYLDNLSGESYSSDIIDHVITGLVQNQEWEIIKSIEPIVNKYGKIEDKSRISWIISRLYYHEFLFTKNRDSQIVSILDSIVTSDNSSYYSYLANALLNRESNIILTEPKKVEELTADDKWIDGFVKYGLVDEAVLYSKQIKDLNYSVSVNVGIQLNKEDKHLDSLRFLSRNNVELNSETYKLYYPLPYKEEILTVSGKYNFPAPLFAGLMRTESGFDMHVVSSAGAVGITQLMPETAIEQANDIGIKNPNLNDPDTNILLGGTYINWLIERFDTLPISFMAYNAGPGNVWRWQRGWGDIPDELFIEASPYQETRDYVPKILRAAIYYGHEEFNTSPYEVVKSLFNDI